MQKLVSKISEVQLLTILKQLRSITIEGVAKYETLDYWGSISDFNYAIRESPNDAKAYFRRGLVKNEVQNYKGAADDFFAAVMFDSEIVHVFCKKCFPAIKVNASVSIL